VIFRDHEANLLCCFAEPLGHSNSYLDEISGALRKIDLACQKNWTNLWLETDSTLVVLAFHKEGQIHWTLRNKWHNMKIKLTKMNCIVIHIFKEGNEVADSLANFGLSLEDFTVWHDTPSFIRSNYVKNKIGMPSFRFKSFKWSFGLVPSILLSLSFINIHFGRSAP